jgi:hypothetical protein
MASGDCDLLRLLLQDARRGVGPKEPLLVLVDWLEEHDDPRGQFIRLQVLAAHLSPHDPRRYPLTAEANQLLRQYETTWLGPIREVVRRWKFGSGLMDVELSEDQILNGNILGVLQSEAWA